MHTPTLEIGFRTVDGIHFHTSEPVGQVYLIEYLVIVHRSTEIVAQHLIIGTAVNTPFRQYGDRQCIRVVGVGIQEGVLVHDGLVVQSGTVSLRLI